jgi:hypothetical protein
MQKKRMRNFEYKKEQLKWITTTEEKRMEYMPMFLTEQGN